VQFERQQKFSDPVLKKCPECGKTALLKIYTPVGIVFKGSGFYATDHRSPSGTASHAQAKSEEKSETPKPAEKSESTTPAPSKSE
jgi:putative FmdB family regulatory protein